MKKNLTGVTAETAGHFFSGGSFHKAVFSILPAKPEGGGEGGGAEAKRYQNVDPGVDPRNVEDDKQEHVSDNCRSGHEEPLRL
jgi:hypothetical protein